MSITDLLKRTIVLGISFLMLFACTTPQVTPQNDKKAESIRDLGAAFLNRRDYASALRELLKAHELNPNDPYVHNFLGLTYMAKKKIALSIDHFKKALRLKPDYAFAKNNLGVAYLELKQWDLAIAQFKLVTEDLMYTTPHRAWGNIGVAYLGKRDYPNAEISFLSALETKPQYGYALWGLGRVYLATKRYQQARQKLEMAVKGKSNSARFYMDLAEAYEKTGGYLEAKQSYVKVMELAPGSQLARTARHRANLIVLP